jgi:hypothetical protein
MQKSHFFVSRKQIFFRPPAKIGAAMNKLIKWSAGGESKNPPRPMSLIPLGLEPVLTPFNGSLTDFVTHKIPMFNGL